MFTQTFCDSPLHLSRSRWTALLSFGLETIAVLALILTPLFHMETLPESKTIATIFTPILRTAPIQQESTAARSIAPPVGMRDARRFMTPAYIPRAISSEAPPAQPPGIPWGHEGAVNPIAQIATGGTSLLPVLRAPGHPTRVSAGVMEGALIEKTQPRYPPLAVTMRVAGAVVLQAIVSREGRIENLQVISGNPFLARAAVDAVSQWRYRPYRLNGVPVEVETQITVNFTLAGIN
jgi:periplasmic protein TonB